MFGRVLSSHSTGFLYGKFIFSKPRKENALFSKKDFTKGKKCDTMTVATNLYFNYFFRRGKNEDNT